MERARAIARGAFALTPTDGEPGPKRSLSLPAAYRPTLARREEAVTPWGEAQTPLRTFEKRETRIMSNSPVAYLI
jgi:hypothetical protein